MENDIFRRKRINLSEIQLFKIDLIKCEAEKLLVAMEPSLSELIDPTCLSIAKTKLEESVMWFIKGLTKVSVYYKEDMPSSPSDRLSGIQDEDTKVEEYNKY